MLPNPPLAIYVHFPWCVQKCPYCDFNSHALRPSGLAEPQYIAALERDLAWQARWVDGRSISSIFLGGGTPSLFSPATIGQVLKSIRNHFAVQIDVEITLEANPGTVERGRFAGYAAAGVNRVSLGAQSFASKSLKTLGRIHDAAETVQAAQEVRAAGITNFNIDLMYGLPQQTADAALYDIEQALALQPSHLSHYQLTLEPGTVFAANPPPLPDEDTIADMLERCRLRLQHAGYPQYEISAYAKKESRCLHNLNYWQFGDYLGIGAGAHGKLTSGDQVLRTVQPREPRRYLSSEPELLQLQPVAKSQLPFEFMLNALRLSDGFKSELFVSRTGIEWPAVASLIQSLTERGLMTCVADFYRPTEVGFQFLNQLLLDFLPEKTLSK
jgi:putative oxygen-independent coproporphyrinogen III oxidase